MLASINGKMTLMWLVTEISVYRLKTFGMQAVCALTLINCQVFSVAAVAVCRTPIDAICDNVTEDV